MLDYVCVTFQVTDPSTIEVLNFHLEQSGVESIEEIENELKTYFVKSEWPAAKKKLLGFLTVNKISYIEQEVENENWNAKWEASFEPVNVNGACFVRAPFHPKSEIANIVDIILEPKMAFGTAHHETTYMMMSQMAKMDFKDKIVFDYGCGTAILAVFAEKLGAQKIYAIDIEELAVENAFYNAEINGCVKIECEQKILSETKPFEYDIILANINRKVLLDTAIDLAGYIKKNGKLLLSGILISDEDLVKNQFLEAGFRYIETIQKSEWKCLLFSK